MKAASYLKGIQNGDISILSQAITLIESTIEKDKETATTLIDLCLQKKKKF